MAWSPPSLVLAALISGCGEAKTPWRVDEYTRIMTDLAKADQDAHETSEIEKQESGK